MMIMKMKVAGLLLCAIVAFSGAARVEAQGIGGLIKKKVEEAKKPDTKADAQTPSIHGGDVLPITSTLLVGFKRGLDTELELRKEFLQVLSAYKTPQQYRACTSETAMTEEAQKILGIFANLPENATAADVQRATEKMGAEMNALVKKRCGGDVNADWPPNKRREKLTEIEAKAAAAVDPAAIPTPDLNDEPAETPGDMHPTAAGVTPRQYGMLKERVARFCMEMDKGNIKLDGKTVTFAGSGTNINWVYTASEAEELWKKCKEVMKALDAAQSPAYDPSGFPCTGPACGMQP
jgi:hypothetical protein